MFKKIRSAMKWIMFIGLYLLVFVYAKAQNEPNSRTDNRLKTAIDSAVQRAVSHFMISGARAGLSIGIVTGDKHFFYNYGTTTKERDRLPDENTVYEIGSVSKTFTGYLLAKAITDRKLRLDDDVRIYLPGSYPHLEYMGKPIKIIHLVNHTSGLPPFLPDRPEIFKQSAESIPFLLDALYRNYTKEMFLADLGKVKLDTLPGYNYRYSNTAAQLLGFILENIYRQSYGQLLKRYLLNPLSMSQTETSGKALTGKLAKGYDAKGTPMPRIPAIMTASGGLYSSAADMARYISFQLKETDMSVKFSHTFTQQYTDSSGIGIFWRINTDLGGVRRIWHTGGTFGFSSYCVIFPEKRIGFVLLSNEFDMTSQGALIEAAETLFREIIGA